MAPREQIASICLISANANSTPRMLIDHARNPSWSPDGQQILYISTANPKPELVVAQLDGSNPLRLSDKRYDVISAAWSPDGKHIAFTSTRPMDAGFFTAARFEAGDDSTSFNGSGIEEMIDTGGTSRVDRTSITPRSQKVPELFITNGSGSAAVHIPSGQYLWCDKFSWSPDNSSIAGICRSGLSGPSALSPSIFVLNVTSPHSKPRVIARGGIESINSAPFGSSQ